MADQINTNTLRAWDVNGEPVPAARLYFYDVGTWDYQTVYSDAALTIPHVVPLAADGEGVFPPIFTASEFIKVSMIDATGTAGVTLPGYPIEEAFIQQSGGAAAQLAFSPVTGNPATDVQAAIEANTAAIVANTALLAALPKPSSELIIRKTADGSGQFLEFTEFDAAKYKNYKFAFEALELEPNGHLVAHMSADGGTGYLSSYQYVTKAVAGGSLNTSTDGVSAQDSHASIFLNHNVLGGFKINGNNSGVVGSAKLYAPNVNKETSLLYNIGYETDSPANSGVVSWGRGVTTSASVVNAIRFGGSTGSELLLTGSVSMHGLF